MYAEQTGDQGPCLLLVHGFPLDHTMWVHQLQDLTDCRRVAVDLLGFGRSPAWPKGGGLEVQADAIAEWLDVRNIERVVYCGLSMGGYIAWDFVRRHSDRLEALILCDTRAAEDSETAQAGRLETADRVEAEGTAALIQGMLPKLFAPDALAADLPCVSATRQAMENASPQSVANALRAMAARPDSRALLPTLNLPVLTLCGRYDVLTPLSEMETMTAAMPQGRLVTIENAGHMAPLEQPAAANAAIREFLHDL